jgi:hypothetical protein
MTAIRAHGNVNARMAVHGIFDHMVMLVRCIWARIVALTLVLALTLATAVPASACVNSYATSNVAAAMTMAADGAMPDGCNDCPRDTVSPSACIAFCASAVILPATMTFSSNALDLRHDLVSLPAFAGHDDPPELHPPRSEFHG